MRSAVVRLPALVLGLLLALPPAAGEEPPAAPSAAQVMVRGKETLLDALEVPLAAVLETRAARARPVLLIVDVTPYTAAWKDRLTLALLALDRRAQRPGTWRLAVPGHLPGEAVPSPGRLVPQLEELLAEDTEVTATVPALDATLRFLSEREAVVVYLADWHFEDDVGLEPFIDRLRAAGHTFHVVGTEACFTRAWTDGFSPPDRGKWIESQHRLKLYEDHIGRNPFGPESLAAPWHGGDTAWPHLPMRLAHPDFSTSFGVELKRPPSRTPREVRPEDLLERIGGKRPEDALERYAFPLPSSFGSYPLLRAAGVTGGRYVLFSWNPYGRSDVVYDYARCNLFPPDLRPRATILADVRRRPLAAALVRAWHHVGNDVIHVAGATPPLDYRARVPLEMREPKGPLYLHTGWPSIQEHRSFLSTAPRYLRALRLAIDELDEGLKSPPDDAVDRRYHADARLFRHILVVKRFQLAEALAAARDLDTTTAWQDLPLHPTLTPIVLIPPGDEPASAVLRDAEPFDPEAAQAVAAERRAFLETYRGTPFGELVARNYVRTYRIVWVGYDRGRPTKTAPGQSGDDGTGPVTPPVTPPGQGSGGSAGPATGR